MTHRVFLVDEAEADILDICRYVMTHDSPEKAEYLFGKLQESCEGLANHPARGHVPPELERVRVYDYREIHFKPYRIIYRVSGKRVYVHCVLDGRRDLQELLLERLLR
jgi:toxin ParE1/3/4